MGRARPTDRFFRRLIDDPWETLRLASFPGILRNCANPTKHLSAYFNSFLKHNF